VLTAKIILVGFFECFPTSN